MRRRLISIASILAFWLAVAAHAYAMAVTYDALGRISSVTADNGTTVYFCYDAAGNRTTVSTTAC